MFRVEFPRPAKTLDKCSGADVFQIWTRKRGPTKAPVGAPNMSKTAPRVAPRSTVRPMLDPFCSGLHRFLSCVRGSPTFAPSAEEGSKTGARVDGATFTEQFGMVLGPLLDPVSALIRGSKFGGNVAPGAFVERFCCGPWKFHPQIWFCLFSAMLRGPNL